MSRKGFFWGLVAGAVIMSLVLMLGGATIWGIDRLRGGSWDYPALRFRIDKRQLPEGFGPRSLSDRFGLWRHPAVPGLAHRGIVGGALCCGPVLLLIAGGIVVMAFVGKHRLGLQCPLHGFFHKTHGPYGGESAKATEEQAAPAEHAKAES